mmetsp:Transcript_37491/g.107302  ORF Transcript_37491/g.107302 Transcript_37491/m.107302 type:complete len:394 (-) Transcript_37491:318-1499(-)
MATKHTLDQPQDAEVRVPKFIKFERKKDVERVKLRTDEDDIMDLKIRISNDLCARDCAPSDIVLIQKSGETIDVSNFDKIQDKLGGCGDSEQEPIYVRRKNERKSYALNNISSSADITIGLRITHWGPQPLPTSPFNQDSFGIPDEDAKHADVQDSIARKVLPQVIERVPDGKKKWAVADTSTRDDGKLEDEKCAPFDLRGSPGDLCIVPKHFVGEGTMTPNSDTPSFLEGVAVVIEVKPPKPPQTMTANRALAQYRGQVAMVNGHRMGRQDPVLGILTNGVTCKLIQVEGSGKRAFEKWDVRLHEAANHMVDFLTKHEPFKGAADEYDNNDDDDASAFSSREEYEEYKRVVIQSRQQGWLAEYMEGWQEGTIPLPRGWKLLSGGRVVREGSD